MPDLLGSIELVEGDTRSALVVAHRFVENQGDAWTVTAAYLGRFIDDQRVLSAAAMPEESPELASYLQPLQQIGTPDRRTAKRAGKPARHSGLRAGADQRGRHRGWTERLVERSDHIFDLLAEKRGGLGEAEQALVDRMLPRASGDRRRISGIRCRARSTR